MGNMVMDLFDLWVTYGSVWCEFDQLTMLKAFEVLHSTMGRPQVIWHFLFPRTPDRLAYERQEDEDLTLLISKYSTEILLLEQVAD